jgi:Ca-activated chloride channel family protein
VSFARPLLLLLLLALPAWWWLRARRLGRLRGVRMSDVRPATRAVQRLWIARLPVTLRSACLGAWIVAAAGPRVGSARIEARSEGISIVLCVDLSSSMLAEDFAPANRIDVAKATALDFVRSRRSDRIGLVAFAAQALTQVPLTSDYAVLDAALQGLRIGMLEDGTAIGTGIATAASRLRRAPGKSKVIVLLTDGVNNRGTVDPRTAAEAAAAFGIRIYTIGVGTRGSAQVPTGMGPDGSLRYQDMPVEIDEALLTDVARGTGGRYFRATDTESLRNIFAEINRLEKSTVEQVVYRRYEEAYRWLLALGLVALALETVVSGTFAVRVP